jgi:hypothetical protein
VQTATAKRAVTSGGQPEPKNVEMLKQLEEFRTSRGWSWRKLEDLCGVRPSTLFHAHRRGTMSDRIAGLVRTNAGHFLESFQVGAGRAQ